MAKFERYQLLCLLRRFIFWCRFFFCVFVVLIDPECKSWIRVQNQIKGEAKVISYGKEKGRGAEQSVKCKLCGSADTIVYIQVVCLLRRFIFWCRFFFCVFVVLIDPECKSWIRFPLRSATTVFSIGDGIHLLFAWPNLSDISCLTQVLWVKQLISLKFGHANSRCIPSPMLNTVVADLSGKQYESILDPNPRLTLWVDQDNKNTEKEPTPEYEPCSFQP
jgi:hypothetical protein